MTTTADTDQIDKTHVIEWTKDDPLVKPERKRSIVAIEGHNGGREYRSIQVPLEFYVARRYITGEQYQAGCRLHALWRGSIISARYARMRFGAPASDFDPENIALMPRDYFRAMDSVHGFQRKAVVRTVCCFDEVAGEGRRMELLKQGLDDLVKHFRT
jgi:hypothetical protein